jgi:imidazolonepropionase-like amidohydrolase
MKRWFPALSTALMVAGGSPSAGTGLDVPALTPRFRATPSSCPAPITAFVGVDVVTMSEAGTLRGQTVVVQDGAITAIGARREVTLPVGVSVVEGNGRLLLPGLTDSHVHLNVDEEQWMRLFIANGVTTVFNQRGSPRHLALRSAVAECRTLGPTIYTSGPFTNQPQVQDADDAIRAVRSQRADGYDFLKIHGDLTDDAYAALTAEGRLQGLAITGHAPRNLTFDAVIDRRQALVAHAEELIYTHFRQLDQQRIPELATRLAASGTWLIPTLSTFRNIVGQWGTEAGLDAALARTERAYLPPRMRDDWRTGNPYLGRDPATRGRLQAMYDFQVPLVRALFEAGVPILTGTDTPLPAMYPGFSIHDEIEELQTAGLPPMAVLAAATRNAGDFVRQHIDSGVRFGRVEVGYRADLILVEGDPTVDLAALRKPAGVMLRGVWFDRPALDDLLATSGGGGLP